MKRNNPDMTDKTLRQVMLWVALWLAAALPLSAQKAFDHISSNLRFSASNYSAYFDSLGYALMPGGHRLTPPPAGKHPFYLSHYGRHGSRYISNRKGYDVPYHILQQADSLGKLTATGRQALQEMQRIIDDAEDQWGDLTDIGRRQHQQIAARMYDNFPEVFSGNAYVDAHSTIINRCVLSMGAAILELTRKNPRLHISMDASQSNMWYMNHQDKVLRARMMPTEAQQAYDRFCIPLDRNPRLMELLFNDSVYVREHVDEKWLSYYLLKAGLMQQNTLEGRISTLVDLFTYEDIHRFWQKENAWWYINYGPSPLSGGDQPFTQRYLLRQIIHDADSCLRLKGHGATLRFGHETVVLPLTCLLGINGFDFATPDLGQLEEQGWWAGMVFPMASNIQFVFYRSSPYDHDVLVKVMLNEQEVRLPIATDMAPYYHWHDFRDHYLHKIDAYEQQRKAQK